MNKTNNHITAFLLECRRRLIWCLIFLTIIFLFALCFSNNLYQLFALPLLQNLPLNQTMIATAITSPFLAPIKLALVFSFFIAIPIFIYHIWAFITPALYNREKHLAFPMLFLSIALFYIGMVFAYFIVLPLVFKFFIHVAPAGVTVMPDISQYLDFTLRLLFAFGLAFEMPIITALLVRTNIVKSQTLREKRPYIVIGILIVSMLLTPPDVISQLLLAIPMWLLFEIGLYLAKPGRIFSSKVNNSKAT